MNIIIKYLLITLVPLGIGLASRIYFPTSGFVHDYVGDAIWAGMIYFGFRMFLNPYPCQKSVNAALVFSFFIEFLQLYHAPWIDAIRKTRLGGLILGFEFMWSDLLSYTIGILIAFIIDIYWITDKLK
ncbi:MAG: hypothetical protein RL329_4158 [Bacteroidota bacterium]|jgi:glycopeptide antibiotics resistance protein